MKYIKKFQEKNGLVADGILGINTINRLVSVLEIPNKVEVVSNFLGQISHESGNFKYGIENLNYSKDGLLSTFSKYFKDDLDESYHQNKVILHNYNNDLRRKASDYARKPEKIANVVYANRMGNRDESSGDGWRHRGAGAIQITGKDNQRQLSSYLGFSRILTPEEIANDFYFESAVFFFKKNNLFDISNSISEDSIKRLTKRINGGYNGLEDRIKLTNHFYKLIKSYE